MKLIYKKPLIFPSWARFSGKSAGKRFQTLTNEGVCFIPQKSKLPYFNHVEMTGFEMSTIISYRIDKIRRLKTYIFCAFPQIRVIPNETRGSLTYHFKSVDVSVYKAEKTVENISINGSLIIEEKGDGVSVIHRFTPGFDKKVLIERIDVLNQSEKSKRITVKNNCPQSKINKNCLVSGEEQLVYTDVFFCNEVLKNKANDFVLQPSQKISFTVVYGAERITSSAVLEQISKRNNFLSDSNKRLKITTPNQHINRMLEFCKIRASESIFNTKNGLMHAPGGGNFYGALWTNDQCEYANPLFAYLGYDAGIEQSLNCYRLYSKFANPNTAIPTSIVACGDDIWNGAGDRGDTSMYLYGLSRFLLSTGDKKSAEEFLSSIKSATEYVIKNITLDGIVKSDSDELENRFESGNANLSVSCITYDAFISLSYLYREFGEEKEADKFLALSEKIKNGIESYFGANVEGFNTYKYCNEEARLRSWICLPLTVGIFERKEETVKALLSDKLYKNGGFLTRSGGKTYWDRSALYTLRGLFYAGEADTACDVLEKYTDERLLGCHPPYPVEAFPEGNSAQLSAESALYLRIIIEGLLGYKPVGFDSFEIKPNLPSKWDIIEINNILLLGEIFNISVLNGECYTLIINDKKVKINKGEKYVLNRKKGTV
ncbi:MAG: hypothetical protein ACI4XC_04555 [Eubacterium sp.]